MINPHTRTPCLSCKLTYKLWQMDADFSKFIGYELKKGQTEAIYSVLSGSDALVVLPTSFSKSMIYQALPWLSVYLDRELFQ